MALRNLFFVFVAAVAVIGVMWLGLGTERWILTIHPTATYLEVKVRLSSSDSTLLEDRINGDWSGIRDTTVRLDRSTRQIPGGEIISADTTVLPGAFQIRFGNELLIIQKNLIQVVRAGKRHQTSTVSVPGVGTRM